MDKHIEELSKPVAWTDAEELQDIERGYSGYLFKINPDDRNIDPRRQIMLYSQEYVDSLLAKLEAAEKDRDELKELNRHFDLSIRKAEGVNEVLRSKLEATEKERDDMLNQEFQQRLANAEHQLYMKDLAIYNIKASRKAQFRKRKALETENAELEERAEAAEARILVPVTADTITEIMQEEWNEWCSDTGCFPGDFEWKGGNGTLSYEASRWSNRVADRIVKLHSASNPVEGGE
ncbi:Uncharacterised protein [Yersinia nurmii]|uniref:Ead/Ea22-like family protein n=1 Tax=Yersinia nurmii TaxID=685706 RepID=A0ABP1YJS3_9GAMM|nr:hypothetical protein [Yersinia nurmii]CNF28010.1 Uncharacterised protein [Yersinia nurmii]